MENNSSIFETQGIDVPSGEIHYENLFLNYNPFSAAGISRDYNLLPIVDQKTLGSIIAFFQSSLNHVKEGKDQEYQGLTIEGDYGMGKTHIMKFFIQEIKKFSDNKQFPLFPVYIPHPGSRTIDIVHQIIQNIGEEKIRKFLWKIFAEELKKLPKETFDELFITSKGLFGPAHDRLVVDNILIHPNTFLFEYEKNGGDNKRLQEYMRSIFVATITPDITIAEKFVELFFENSLKIWEVLVGNVTVRDITNKEKNLLDAIINILKKQGYNHLYVFIDEFEAVTKDKLSKAKLIDYITSLTFLINQEYRWSLIIASNPSVLDEIRRVSAPLYDRLTSKKITVEPLNEGSLSELIINYLDLSRDESNTKKGTLYPFQDENLSIIMEKSEGRYRRCILYLHQIIEKAKELNLTGSNLPFNNEFLNTIETF